MNTTSIDKLPPPVMSYILSFIPEDKKLRTVSKFFKKCFDYNFNIKLTNIEKNNNENPKFIEIITDIRKKDPSDGGFVWFKKFIDFNNINDNKFLEKFLPNYKEKLKNKTLIDTYKLGTLKGMSNLNFTVAKRITAIVNSTIKVITHGHMLNLRMALLNKLSFSSCDLFSIPTGIINFYAKIVTPESEYRLIELSLPNNKIFFIPKEIGLLQKQLKIIDLSDNDLSSVPHEIGDLVKLEKFNIAGNKIECLPETMKNLENLQQLNVQRNPLNESSITVVELKEKLGEKMLLPSEVKLPGPQDDKK